MIDFNTNTKYKIEYTSKFKRQLRKIVKQNKNINELLEVVTRLANLEELELKYKNHNLINDKIYRNCKECHIRIDWLLVYKYVEDRLVILLINRQSW